MAVFKHVWFSSWLLSLLLTSCITVNPGFTFPTTPPPPTLADFNGRLIAALVNRDSATLQTLMGTQFLLADWPAAGQEMTSDQALLQLQDRLLAPLQSISFVPQEVAAGWLGGSDPLSLWPAQVSPVAALGLRVQGPNTTDELLLAISQVEGGPFFWSAAILARDGFAAAPLPATSISPAPPLSDLLPTEVTRLLVLGTVGLFEGPGSTFRQLGLAERGFTYTVLGVSPDSQWWAVRCELGTQTCWIGTNPTLVRPISQTAPPAASHTAAPTALPPAYPIQIQFGPGETNAVRSGTLPASQFQQYLFQALAGQSARILLDSPGGQANFALQGLADGVIYKPFSSPARESRLILPTTQQYLISINGPPAIRYQIELIVQPLNPTPTPARPERILFAPGAIRATRDGSLWAHTPRTYLFGAMAGQTAQIRFTSPSPAASFAVKGSSDGVLYKSMTEPSREWRWLLPTTQEYLITVQAPVNTSFTLELTIPPAPTATPTEEPTAAPTVAPTVAPTAAPTEEPTAAPTEEPTAAPTEEPTAAPTEEPTEEPTAAPTEEPTAAPTEEPTAAPTEEPTAAPTEEPG